MRPTAKAAAAPAPHFGPKRSEAPSLEEMDESYIDGSALTAADLAAFDAQLQESASAAARAQVPSLAPLGPPPAPRPPDDPPSYHPPTSPAPSPPHRFRERTTTSRLCGPVPAGAAADSIASASRRSRLPGTFSQYHSLPGSPWASPRLVNSTHFGKGSRDSASSTMPSWKQEVARRDGAAVGCRVCNNHLSDEGLYSLRARTKIVENWVGTTARWANVEHKPPQGIPCCRLLRPHSQGLSRTHELASDAPHATPCLLKYQGSLKSPFSSPEISLSPQLS